MIIIYDNCLAMGRDGCDGGRMCRRPDVGVRMDGSVAGMHTRLSRTGAERQGCKVRRGLQTWKRYKADRSHTHEYVLEQLSDSN